MASPLQRVDDTPCATAIATADGVIVKLFHHTTPTITTTGAVVDAKETLKDVE